MTAFPSIRRLYLRTCPSPLNATSIYSIIPYEARAIVPTTTTTPTQRDSFYIVLLAFGLYLAQLRYSYQGANDTNKDDDDIDQEEGSRDKRFLNDAILELSNNLVNGQGNLISSNARRGYKEASQVAIAVDAIISALQEDIVIKERQYNIYIIVDLGKALLHYLDLPRNDIADEVTYYIKQDSILKDSYNSLFDLVVKCIECIIDYSRYIIDLSKDIAVDIVLQLKNYTVYII